MAGGIAEKGIGQELATSAEGQPTRISWPNSSRAGEWDPRTLSASWSGGTARAVLGICRHILDREHDAEDAFQATFLALARNGASIRDRCALGGWLQEVAYRTALKTRARRSRRRMIEKQVMAMPVPRAEPDDQGEKAELAELRPVLHEEVVGLPDKYRIPVVLSYLEGKTNEEVAALLKWPVGTVKGRLSRGRALLRSRLTRRGVALSTATLLMALSRARAATADVSGELIEGTFRLAFGTGSVPVTLNLPSSPAAPTTDAAPPHGSAPTSGQPGSGEVIRTGSRRRFWWRPFSASVGAADAASSSTPAPASPPTLGEKGPRPSRPGWLAAAALLLLVFSAAVLVGGLVSAATYGGRFPDLRSAISGLMPSWKGNTAHCQR